MGNDYAADRRAIYLAAVCSQTYAQYADPGGQFVVPQGFSVRHVIEARSAANAPELFGFVLESPLEVIVAFRGTVSANDWLSDMIASQKRFKYVRQPVLTHRGFTDIYSTAREGILAAVRGLPPDKTLYVTGHSLGAALATLCAADLAEHTDFVRIVVYTFGSPRVGDDAFAKWFARSIPDSRRYANPFDIVTFAPPAVYKLPKRDKTYYYSHVRALDSLPFQNGAVGLNHVISSYFAALAKLEPEYAAALCRDNPGFCPLPAASPSYEPPPVQTASRISVRFAPYL